MGMCVDRDFALGVSNAATGSRVSHIFGLSGPVVVTDTACSSSLTATNIAHTALRRHNPKERLKPIADNNVSNALVIGSSIIVSPRIYLLYCQPHMLSVRGRCFTFDSSADGYARGEGVCSLYMKASDELNDLRNALACLIGSATNQDGRSASMTAPNGPSQQQVIRSSMEEAQITLNLITMAECHGTGTALGDPIEVSALRMVMQDRKAPILNTSAKANIGHLEACAGLTGLLKCVFSCYHGNSCASNHLYYLNPHMDTNSYPVYFLSEAEDFGDNTSFCGVSSFGFGGTNARGDVWGRAQAGARKTEEVTSLEWYERRGVKYERLFHF